MQRSQEPANLSPIPRDMRRLTSVSWLPPGSPESCGAPILITASHNRMLE